MTTIIIIALSIVLGILLTQRSWRKFIQKKAQNQTAITFNGEIYYVLPSEDYYKVYLKAKNES